MSYSALVKTSDQPLFILLAFRRLILLRLSDHQISVLCQSLNLQPYTRGGTAKKMISTYRKFVGATQEKKIKQATKPKTNRLALNALLVPSKRRKRRVCWDPNPSDTPSDSDTDLAFPFADNSTEEEKEAACLFCTGLFSENHNGKEWIRSAKYFRWGQTLCACMEEDSVCEFCQG